MRKRSIMIGILLFATITTGCATANMSLLSFEAKGPGAAFSEQNMEQQTEAATEQMDVLENAEFASADIRSGYFKIDGSIYKMPVKAQDFIDHEWTIDWVSRFATLEKNGLVLYAEINDTGNEGIQNTIPFCSINFVGEALFRSGYGPGYATGVEFPRGLILSNPGYLSDFENMYGKPDASGQGHNLDTPEIIYYHYYDQQINEANHYTVEIVLDPRKNIFCVKLYYNDPNFKLP